MTQLNKQIPDQLHHKLKVYAAKNGITIQQAVIKALEKLLTTKQGD